jgi:hypothetical protein
MSRMTASSSRRKRQVCTVIGISEVIPRLEYAFATDRYSRGTLFDLGQQAPPASRHTIAIGASVFPREG